MAKDEKFQVFVDVINVDIVSRREISDDKLSKIGQIISLQLGDIYLRKTVCLK